MGKQTPFVLVTISIIVFSTFCLTLSISEGPKGFNLFLFLLPIELLFLTCLIFVRSFWLIFTYG